MKLSTGAALVVLALTVPAYAAGGPLADHATVAETLQAYAEAVGSKDLERVGELVSEDLTVFEGTHVNRGWADYRDHHLAPELEEFEHIHYVIDDIESSSNGDLGWATFRYQLHIRIDGRDIAVNGIGTAVLVNDAEAGWRIRHLQTAAERRSDG